MNKGIGLGKFACIVVDEMAQHPEYTIYKFEEESKSPDTFALDYLQDMKEYEEKINIDEVRLFLRSVVATDKVLVVVDGGTPISGAILKILKLIKESSLSVLYLVPDAEMLSSEEATAHRICFGVLQEYARSGVLENLFIIDIAKAEEMVGDVPVAEYERSVANFISYIVAMVNYFAHTPPVLESKISRSPWCNISSFALATFENTLLRDLFSVENIESIHFYYGIPEAELERDNTLIKKIKSHVKNQKNGEKAVSFSVFSTTFERIMILGQAYTSHVQPVEQI